MKISKKFFFALTVFSALGLVSSLQAWEKKQAPLMTKWADEVSPTNALPEYPRPQLVRKAWLNLNGVWEFEGVDGITKRIPSSEWTGVDNAIFKDVKFGKKLSGEILVPYPVESALSGVMKHYEYLKYRREFEVPSAWAGQNVMLNFGAVDYMCDVYINGKLAGSHDGGYDSFSFDITKFLKAGKNEIIVSVYDPTDNGTQPVGKQRIEPEGYWYTPCSGIWQTVWLEPVNKSGHVASLKMIPNVKDGFLSVIVNTDGDAQAVELTAFDGNKVVGHASGSANSEIHLVIRKEALKLWSPDSPFLYDLKIKLLREGALLDEVDSYFGMREIAIKNINGILRPTINGEFVFHIGTLDQGYWPDGNLTAPTDEALKSDILNHKKLGMNMVRKHIKVEPARWFYWCDKIGIMVWQDMPNMHTHSLLQKGKDAKRISFRPNAEERKVFEKYLKELIDEHISHPCIVAWVLFNEGWSIYERKDVKVLADWVKQYDPSRMVNDSTGLPNEHSTGDVYDIHIYQGPSASVIPDNTIAVLGEFGGVGLNVKDHNWFARGGWAYGDMNASNDDLTKRYLEMQKELYGMMIYPGLCASMYTQISDVEGETNGLYTYDRKVLKMNEAAIKAAHDKITSASKNLPFFTDANSPLSFAQKGKLVSVKAGKDLQFKFLKDEKSKDANITAAIAECSFNLPRGESASAGIVMRATKDGGYLFGAKGDGTIFIKSFGENTETISVEKKVELKGKLNIKAHAFGSVLYLDVNGNKISAKNAFSFYGKCGVFAQNTSIDFANFKICNSATRIRANKTNVKFIVPRDKDKRLRLILDCNPRVMGEVFWDIEKGLSDPTGVSFRSMAYPTKYFAQDENGDVYLEEFEDTPEFRKRATWFVRKGNSDESKVSFESAKEAGIFLRHKAWNLTNSEIKSNADKDDSTFEYLP